VTTRTFLRGAVDLMLAYAVGGFVGALVLAVLGSSLDDSFVLMPLVVLAVALGLAAILVALVARLAIGWLDGRVGDPVVAGVVLASVLVLAAGVSTHPSLGLLGVGVGAVLALVTYLVLTRRWA